MISLERWAAEKPAIKHQPRSEESQALVTDVPEVGDVERWPKAARLAGRNLGHPARTML